MNYECLHCFASMQSLFPSIRTTRTKKIQNEFMNSNETVTNTKCLLRLYADKA